MCFHLALVLVMSLTAALPASSSGFGGARALQLREARMRAASAARAAFADAVANAVSADAVTADTITDTITNTITSTITNTNTDTDADTVSVDTITGTIADSISNSVSADTITDTDLDTITDAVTDADTDTNTDTNADTNTDSNTDTNTGANTDTITDATTDPVSADAIDAVSVGATYAVSPDAVAAVDGDTTAAFVLSVLVAAEERHQEDPAVVAAEVEACVSALAEGVSTRLRLASALAGGEPSIASIATALSTTLFGSDAAEDSEGGFFDGNRMDYYDARNSMMDSVISRRRGIPITLSLLYAEVARRVGVRMVGLNAPGHLLLTPAEASGHFAVDCFNGGTLLSGPSLLSFLAERSGVPMSAAPALLSRLVSSPMQPLTWTARLLRKLRLIYHNQGDAVRLLGAADRSLILASCKKDVMPRAEVFSAEREVALCVITLEDDERAAEADGLLRRSVSDDNTLNPEQLARLQHVLETPWLRERC